MAITLSVVMFAYNEAENIVSVVEETVSSLEALQAEGRLSGWQLVLVDDGSKDATYARILELAARWPQLTPMTHGTNRGIGAAVKTGFAACTQDYVTILPADGQVLMSEVVKLMGSVEEGADMAVGYYTQRRAVDGGFRMFLSKGLRQVMNLALGTQRPMDGVYLFRRELLRRLPLKSETFFVNLELPVRAIRERYDVRSVPVEVRARRAGHSKVLGVGRIARVGLEVLKFRVNLLAEQRER